jgi:hypothetical protein
MLIYLDESGDLGWKFDAPYRQGGSSRYLTLAFLFVPKRKRNYPKDIIKKLYLKYGWQNEKKASKATLQQKIRFCTKAMKFLEKHTDIKIDAIVTNKINVESHIRSDANKLYNYMNGLVIPHYVGTKEKVEFIPDKRSIKVKSGNSLIDYLQIKIWFDHKYKTVIVFNPHESQYNYNLQFADWISHCIWLKYEDSIEEPFNILYPYINIRTLFF